MDKITLCVLFGGVSSEHEVSCRSALSILENINREKYDVMPVGITKSGQWKLISASGEAGIVMPGWENHPENREAFISPVRGHGILINEGGIYVRRAVDVCFPVLHGENGEDGGIQGLLQVAGIRFVGSGVEASAVCMDKATTKSLLAGTGIRMASWRAVRDEEFARFPEKVVLRLEKCFSYPVFVKPARTGSSVGVSKAKDRAELEAALKLAFVYDTKALCEECIDGREIETAVLGNSDPVVSGCGEIVPGDEFYTYETKYLDDRSEVHTKADIAEETSERIREAAARIFTLLECRGLARVDFFLDRIGGEIIFNEINTLPGFTSISMYPKLFEEAGIAYPLLIDRLITLATEERAHG